MRILFISAFYPPYVIGGWEQLVQDINERLQAHGHVTHVLTSSYGVTTSVLDEPGVERKLHLESDLRNYQPRDFFFRRPEQVRQNLAVTQETIDSFQPDVIFIHVMWNLTRGIAWQAEKLLPGRVVYYVANDWPYAPDTHQAYWQDPAASPGRKLLKGLLAPVALRILDRQQRQFPLRFERVLCVSQAIRRDLAQNAGIPLDNMQVVYNGVETDRFVPAGSGEGQARPPDSRALSLLYAGSLVSHKGVHTAIEAMKILAEKPGLDGITLTIVGSGHPDYEAYLHKLVSASHLEERIHFLPRVSREEMPELLQSYNVLVFPSTWEEPLARMTQEAMAAGLAVVGTPTGGTPEILIDGETGLVFPPGNAAELAERVVQLYRDPALMSRLAQRGRELVLQKFDIRRMIDEIEAVLAETLEEPALPAMARIS